MTMKQKIMIFPYDKESAPLLRSDILAEKYEFIPCCLKGAGLIEGEDACTADTGEKTNVFVINDFEIGLEQADIVLFVKSSGRNIYEESLYPRIINVLERKKDVLDFVSEKDKIEEFMDISKKNGSRYIHHSSMDKDFFYDDNYKQNMICDEYIRTIKLQGLTAITTPVVTILGSSENTHKFDIQIELYEFFKKMGYNVAWIGTKKYSSLLSGYTFPNFMIEHNFDDQESVLLFNRYIKRVEELEKPDVIIIGVPGGIMPCNKAITGDFGSMAYKVCQSVSADLLILSVFREEYMDTFFKEMELLTKYRLGKSADIINICNRQIDWTELEMILVDSIPFITADLQEMKDYIKQMQTLTDLKLMNATDSKNISDIGNFIIDKLSDVTPEIIF